MSESGTLLTGSNSSARILGCFVGAVVVVTILIGGSGAVHHHSQLVDTIAYLDAVWRIHVGQVPHRDFHNIVGVLPFGITSWIMGFTSADANAMAYANALFFALLCALGWVLLIKRYEPMTVAITSLGLGFILIAPRMLGYDVDLTTYAVNYNRLGWAFLGLLSLAVLQPRRDQTLTRDFEWLLFGLLGAGLFFTKVNFGITAFLAIVGLWLRERGPLRAVIGVLTGSALIFILCRLTWGVEFSAYWKDISYALSVNTGATYRERVWELSAANLESAAILGIQLVVAWPIIKSFRPEYLATRLVILGMLVSLPAFYAVALTNTHVGPLPILAVSGFALAELIRRLVAAAPSEADVLRHRVVAMLSVLLLGLVVVPDMFCTARAMAWHWQKKLQGRDQPRLGGVLAPIALPLQLSENPTALVANIAARPPHHFGMSSAELKAHAEDAVSLLRNHGQASGQIVSMDFYNPIHLLLGTVPARGDWICWDPNTNFSRARHIPPAELLSDATAVLVPKRSFCMGFALVKWDIYSPAILKDFREKDSSKLWTLYVRVQTAKIKVDGSTYVGSASVPK